MAKFAQTSVTLECEMLDELGFTSVSGFGRYPKVHTHQNMTEAKSSSSKTQAESHAAIDKSGHLMVPTIDFTSTGRREPLSRKNCGLCLSRFHT